MRYQLYNAVETDEKDSEMSSLSYGEAQLIPFVVDERVNKQVDMDEGEPQESLMEHVYNIRVPYYAFDDNHFGYGRELRKPTKEEIDDQSPVQSTKVTRMQLTEKILRAMSRSWQR